MRRELRLWAAVVSLVSAAVMPAQAEETPRYGGTLTYMIPADAPPSFDAQRENTRVLGDQVHYIHTYWWNRIVPLRSYVKGWKIGPSHYVNQDLGTIWLDQ